MTNVQIVQYFTIFVFSSVFWTACGSEETDVIDQMSPAIDTGWVLNNAYLVFFMQCGFAMLESGMVRAKNTKNIIIKNVVDTSVVALGFWALGYAFAFGSDPSTRNGFVGLRSFLLINTTEYQHWIFEWAFCAAAATIASGSLAERTQMTAYMIYSVVISVLIFPMPAHWTWSPDGWLRKLGANGMIDFAGGSIVHILGGVVGLVGAWIAGPRLGRFQSDAERKPVEIPGHASVLSALGTLILWYCWYGFNTGSTLGLTGDKFLVSKRISVVTTLSATSAACVTLVWRRITTKQYDINMLLNGVLAGLVASTAGCAVLEPWAAVIVGAFCGPILIGSSALLVRIGIDDPLDATPVHLFCGLWGTFSVSLFASKDYISAVYGPTEVYGLFMGGGFGQMWVQIVGMIAVIGWSFVFSYILFAGLNKIFLLRVTQDTELAGLDNTNHGGPAYPYFQQL